MIKLYKRLMKVNVKRNMLCLIVIGVIFGLIAITRGYVLFGDRIAYFLSSPANTKLELLKTIDLGKSDYLYVAGVCIAGVMLAIGYGVNSIIYMVQKFSKSSTTVKKIITTAVTEGTSMLVSKEDNN